MRFLANVALYWSIAFISPFILSILANLKYAIIEASKKIEKEELQLIFCQKTSCWQMPFKTAWSARRKKFVNALLEGEAF